MSRRATGLLLALLAVVIFLPLAGCGKKAAPLPPDGNEFPRQYPSW